MYSCHDISERSSAHLEGELSLRERVRFWLHLAICGHCRRYTRQLAATIRTMPLRVRRDKGDSQGEEEALRSIIERHARH